MRLIKLIVLCSMIACIQSTVMQEIASSAYHELVSDASTLAAHMPSLAGPIHISCVVRY